MAITSYLLLTGVQRIRAADEVSNVGTWASNRCSCGLNVLQYHTVGGHLNGYGAYLHANEMDTLPFSTAIQGRNGANSKREEESIASNMEDVRKRNVKAIIAKRLIVFNALCLPRPRTENGRPVLYYKIKQNTSRNRTDTETDPSWRRSVRSSSDPSIAVPYSAVIEELNTRKSLNEVDIGPPEVCVTMDNTEDTEPAVRKTVKDLMSQFETRSNASGASDSPRRSPSPNLGIKNVPRAKSFAATVNKSGNNNDSHLGQSSVTKAATNSSPLKPPPLKMQQSDTNTAGNKSSSPLTTWFDKTGDPISPASSRSPSAIDGRRSPGLKGLPSVAKNPSLSPSPTNDLIDEKSTAVKTVSDVIMKSMEKNRTRSSSTPPVAKKPPIELSNRSASVELESDTKPTAVLQKQKSISPPVSKKPSIASSTWSDSVEEDIAVRPFAILQKQKSLSPPASKKPSVVSSNRSHSVEEDTSVKPSTSLQKQTSQRDQSDEDNVGLKRSSVLHKRTSRKSDSMRETFSKTLSVSDLKNSTSETNCSSAKNSSNDSKRGEKESSSSESAPTPGGSLSSSEDSSIPGKKVVEEKKSPPVSKKPVKKMSDTEKSNQNVETASNSNCITNDDNTEEEVNLTTAEGDQQNPYDTVECVSEPQPPVLPVKQHYTRTKQDQPMCVPYEVVDLMLAPFLSKNDSKSSRDENEGNYSEPTSPFVVNSSESYSAPVSPAEKLVSETTNIISNITESDSQLYSNIAELRAENWKPLETAESEKTVVSDSPSESDKADTVKQPIEIQVNDTKVVSENDSDLYCNIAEIKAMRKDTLTIDSRQAIASDSSSWYSDDNDVGWDSDEFDDYEGDATDDEVLGEKKQNGDELREQNPVKKKLFNIVNEILTTERSYVKKLHLLDKTFQERLFQESKENGLIPEKVIQEIFSNLSSIHTFHSTILLPDLEKRIGSWSATEKIGDIFKTLGHLLKLYTEYVKNFDHATTTLNQWMKKSPKLASLIEEIQRQPECEFLTLQHHMLGPIQRIPRYKLLLQDYLKKLPQDSPDRKDAEEALAVISEAASHANNSMKGMEQFKKLIEIEDRFAEGLRGERLAMPSRVFVKEGELTKIAARSDQRSIRVLLLFSDVMLCCNKVPGTSKLRLKINMEIAGMTIQEGADVDLGEKYSFRVRSRQRVLDLAASSDEEKNDWMEAIGNVIKDFEDKRGSLLRKRLEEDEKREIKRTGTLKVGSAAPVWVKDEEVTMCMLCALRFSVFTRRHHCRGCGRIVCESCSKYRAALDYTNKSVKRVCFACHRKINLAGGETSTAQSPTLERVARDPKRRMSTVVNQVKGYLKWKGPGKGWNRNYFALSDYVLYAHKGKKDPKAFMTVPLPGFAVEPPSPADEIDPSHNHVFKLHHGNKKDMTYYFEADNEATMERWIYFLEYAVKAEKPPPAEMVKRT